MTQSHVLIVDDDTRLRQLLHKYLEREGFIISEAADADEADDLLKFITPDAIIMDVMMPRKNGDVFTKELRQHGFTLPILMLTAMGDTNSRISGLEAGADDYLPKPFEPKELLLRLHNLLKRNPAAVDENVSFGPYQYTPANGHLSNGDEAIVLTSAEQDLLSALIKNLNQVVSREQLASSLHIDNIRTIDVQMTRLRKKLDTKTQHLIQTIRGKGYRLISA